MAQNPSPYGPDWPDLSQHWQAGYARLRRPPGGHTWHGDGDLAGYLYQLTAVEEVRRDGLSILVVRFYPPPPLSGRPPIFAEGGR
jgi:hypothetical protein